MTLQFPNWQLFRGFGGVLNLETYDICTIMIFICMYIYIYLYYMFLYTYYLANFLCINLQILKMLRLYRMSWPSFFWCCEILTFFLSTFFRNFGDDESTQHKTQCGERVFFPKHKNVPSPKRGEFFFFKMSNCGGLRKGFVLGIAKTLYVTAGKESIHLYEGNPVFNLHKLHCYTYSYKLYCYTSPMAQWH